MFLFSYVQITEEFKETMDNYIDDYMSDDGLPDADWLYDDLHLGDLNDIGTFYYYFMSYSLFSSTTWQRNKYWHVRRS
jgi:hypothetical protein